jgi:hypothetical protein
LFSFFPGLPLLPIRFPSFSPLFLSGSIGFPVPDYFFGDTGDSSVEVYLKLVGKSATKP